jgi:hypothetical protein
MVRALTAPRQRQKSDKKQGLVTFQTASSVRGLQGERREEVSCRIGGLGSKDFSAERDVNGILWAGVRPISRRKSFD